MELLKQIMNNGYMVVLAMLGADYTARVVGDHEAGNGYGATIEAALAAALDALERAGE